MEKVNVVEVVKELTYLQKERYNALFSIYGEDALLIVNALGRVGNNSWSKVQEKCIEVNRAKGGLRDYYERLDQAFSEEGVLDDNTIVQIVTEIRAEHEMPAFVKQIKAQCLKEFFRLFIYEESKNPGALREYRIKCRLLS